MDLDGKGCEEELGGGTVEMGRTIFYKRKKVRIILRALVRNKCVYECEKRTFS